MPRKYGIQPRMAEPLEAPPTIEDSQALIRRIAIGASAYVWGSNLLYLLTRGAMASPDRWETVYLVILGAYAGGQEVKSWAKGVEPADYSPWQERLRKGGPLLVAWTGLLLLAGLLRQWDSTFPMPPELPSITISVLGLFTGTYVFRQYRRARPLSSRAGLGPRAPERDVDQADRQRIADLLSKGDASSGNIRDSLNIAPRTLARLLKSMLDDGAIQRQAKSPTDPNAEYRLKK